MNEKNKVSSWISKVLSEALKRRRSMLIYSVVVTGVTTSSVVFLDVFFMGRYSFVRSLGFAIPFGLTCSAAMYLFVVVCFYLIKGIDGRFHRKKDNAIAEDNVCQREIAWYRHMFGKFGFGIGLALNSIVLFTFLPIAVHASYAPTRPMGWAVLVFLLEGAGVVVGLPLSVTGFILDTKKKYAGWGIVFCITPLPLGIFLIRLLVVCGFLISP